MKLSGKIRIMLIFFLSLALAAGCEMNGADNNAVYNYYFDEITYGYFGSLVPEMTLNEWCHDVLPSKETYDNWTQREQVFLYKDSKLKKPYSGSDKINETSQFFCDFSFNGLGRRNGRITGTITLTYIPDPGTKVHIVNLGFKDGDMWTLTGKINLNGKGIVGENLKWSVPAYDTFIPNTTSTFILYVLPEDSMYPFELLHQTTNVISKPNENIGHLGDREIKGVKLSGTIDITYKGEPVPYLEIHTLEAREMLNNATFLSYPKKDAPWSVTLGTDINNTRNIGFRIAGYSDKNKTENYLLFDILANQKASIKYNESIADIDLKIGDVK